MPTFIARIVASLASLARAAMPYMVAFKARFIGLIYMLSKEVEKISKRGYRLLLCLLGKLRNYLPLVVERAHQYAILMRLDRKIGIYLLLWPTLWSLWIAAAGIPDPAILLIFIGGVIVMRSLGCVINDYVDRDIDKAVQRTADRPLATGIVSLREVYYLIAVLAVIASYLLLSLNILTIYIAGIGVVLTLVYPFCKRFTYLPQLVLGCAFAWSVPMAFAAQTDAIPRIAWVLFFAVVVWVMLYDTMYAMADRDDDIRIGVKSTAILFAEADRFVLGILQILLLLILVLLGCELTLAGYYFMSVGIGALLFIYQQILIRDRKAAHCLQAFYNNHWFGVVIFIGLLLSYA